MTYLPLQPDERLSRFRVFLRRKREPLTWGLVGAISSTAVYVTLLIASLRSAATTGLSVAPGNEWVAALAYFGSIIVATSSLLILGGLLTIFRPLRPFALGMIAGTGFGLVVVSAVAWVVIPSAS